MASPFQKAPDKPSSSTQSTVFEYADNRDKHWNITTKTTKDGTLSVNWWYSAQPAADAQAFYELPDSRVFQSAPSRDQLIHVIEEAIEDAAAAGQAPGVFFKDFYKAGGGGGGTLSVTASPDKGVPWWLLLLGAYLLFGKKKR